MIRIRNIWCRLAHPRIMHPVKGRYLCASCYRPYPVLWGPTKPFTGQPHAGSNFNQQRGDA